MLIQKLAREPYNQFPSLFLFANMSQLSGDLVLCCISSNCKIMFYLLSAIFMFLACVIYPSGWDNQELMTICGPNSGRYRMGDCNMRWAYILAILGIFDAAILAVLAFFLASKRAKIEMYTSSGAVTKCEY